MGAFLGHSCSVTEVGGDCSRLEAAAQRPPRQESLWVGSPKNTRATASGKSKGRHRSWAGWDTEDLESMGGYWGQSTRLVLTDTEITWSLRGKKQIMIWKEGHNCCLSGFIGC